MPELLPDYTLKEIMISLVMVEIIYQMCICVYIKNKMAHQFWKCMYLYFTQGCHFFLGANLHTWLETNINEDDRLLDIGVASP